MLQSQRGHVLRLPFMWFGPDVRCLLYLRQVRWSSSVQPLTSDRLLSLALLALRINPVLQGYCLFMEAEVCSPCDSLQSFDLVFIPGTVSYFLPTRLFVLEVSGCP